MLLIMYGRGEKSIAEQLNCTIEEAKAIKDDVYNGFPAIKDFEEASYKMVKEKGYVTTLWGRKRRLPEMRLPEYEFRYDNNEPVNPIDNATLCAKFAKIRTFREKQAALEDVRAKGFIVIENSKKIADAQRQVINSRVQGSASDMSKKAMIAVNNDTRLKELKGQVIIPVHDELILQSPLRNARIVKELFAYDMEHAAEDRLTVPIKCDVTTTFEWYGEELDLDKELEGLYDD